MECCVLKPQWWQESVYTMPDRWLDTAINVSPKLPINPERSESSNIYGMFTGHGHFLSPSLSMDVQKYNCTFYNNCIHIAPRVKTHEWGGQMT